MVFSVSVLVLFVLSSIPTVVVLIGMGQDKAAMFVVAFALIGFREIARMTRAEQQVNLEEQDRLIRSFSEDVRRT